MLFGLQIFTMKKKTTLKYSSIKSQLLKMLAILTALLIGHTLAIVYLEHLSLGDALWLTMTSATTVGYGDLYAKTVSGRVATIVLIYIGGIATLTQVAALCFEYRQELRDRQLTGDWSWKMKNHIVFLNVPQELKEDYFIRAISGLRDSSSEAANFPIIIVCEHFKEDLSNRLRKLGVVHVSKTGLDDDTLHSACVLTAHSIVILSQDRFNFNSDSINFDLVDRLRDMGVKGRIISEAVSDKNRKRLKKVGANNVIRPIRTYPELLIRTIITPGSEQVIETLFDSSGEECLRYEIKTTGVWKNIVNKFLDYDFGTPIAYETGEEKIINNPSAKDTVDTKAIFVVANKDRIRKSHEIEKFFLKS